MALARAIDRLIESKLESQLSIGARQKQNQTVFEAVEVSGATRKCMTSKCLRLEMKVVEVRTPQTFKSGSGATQVVTDKRY